jgi:hypothetical protein
VIGLTSLTVGVTGCESLPGTRGQQGAVVGAATGGAAGAAGALLGEDRLLGALVGGTLGAGAGYLIGAKTDWLEGDLERGRHAAERSIVEARQHPASVADVQEARTGDLNRDGFVTQDELVAMEKAGLSDAEILERLRDTGQIFELDPRQEEELIASGVSPRVVVGMRELNLEGRQRVLSGPVRDRGR